MILMTITIAKKPIAMNFVYLASVASMDLDLFLERNVSAPPLIAPRLD